jgi:hypothetical protein
MSAPLLLPNSSSFTLHAFLRCYDVCLDTATILWGRSSMAAQESIGIMWFHATVTRLQTFPTVESFPRPGIANDRSGLIHSPPGWAGIGPIARLADL